MTDEQRKLLRKLLREIRAEQSRQTREIVQYQYKKHKEIMEKIRQ